MKIAYIEATLPELKGGNSHQTGRGEATNSKAAISRAFGDMFKKVRKRRISVITCRIVLTEKAGTQEEPCQDQK